MRITHKMVVTAAGVLVVAGAGIGTALAQAGGHTTTAPPSANLGTPASNVTSVVSSAGADTPNPTDTDTVQSGDQTTPDRGEAPGTQEKAGAESEKAGAEEPGDANLPGGGHADPEGQNVDHQFNGVE